MEAVAGLLSEEDSMEYVNQAQKWFTYAGYYGNWCARGSVRCIERLTHPMPRDRASWWGESVERVGRAALAVILVPLAAAFSIPALACYGLATLAGRGRFELIQLQPEEPDARLAGRLIGVMSWNACLQDPWSPLTGGVTPPQEYVTVQQTRVAAVAQMIAQTNPVLFLGQEFESLGAQDEAIRCLRAQGFRYFLRDTGANDPIRNNSGLFVASKIPLENIQFRPYPSEDRAGLAKWSNQGALTFTVRVGDEDVRFVNVHLNYGEGPEDQAARERQLARHVAPLLEGHSVCFGDLNFDTSTCEQLPGLAGFKNELEGRVTCTDQGKHTLRGKVIPPEGCPDCAEKIDGIIYHPQSIKVSEVQLIQNPTLSDHFASVALVQIA